MNLIALAAAFVLVNEAAHSSDYGDAKLSAAIEYTTVDRSGNVLTVSVASGDPYYGRYYGRDVFLYDDCVYYRRYHPVRAIVLHDPVVYRRPVYVTDDRDYWKAVEEHDKRWAKAASEHDKRWAKVERERVKQRGKSSRGKHGKGR